MKDDLFSPDLDKRYRASVEVGEKVPWPPPWPRASWGAANAWLMLVCPSPGAAGSDQSPWKGGPARPIDSTAKIGSRAGVIRFDSNPSRNKRWDLLRATALGREDYADALTAVVNLDWGHHPRHEEIPKDYLLTGCATAFGLMVRARPRVAVTLVRRTWEVFSEFLKNAGMVLHTTHALGRRLDSMVIRFPGSEATTLVVRSPQHPSRHFFTIRHANQLRQEIERFLRDGS